ncbi:MAG: Crp/Fnr family transcriptional regulator, partial [Hyphomicrobiales bacterium]
MSRDILQSAVRNRLLRNLPEQAFSLLAPDFEPVELSAGMVLELPDAPIEHIIYLESGIAA